ncbi:MAG: transketolase [Ignavibacteria bacterium]|nr:transketolase [Ignavibacteria bacterium]
MSYENFLYDIALRDERLVVLTAENRAAIRNLPLKLGNRFIDTGITEQTMTGIAAGLALRGRIPVTHALAAFLTMRAFEFIRTDVGLPALPVKMVGGVAGFLSEANGPTHQALEDISIMRGIPNVNVFAPADEEDMLIGLETVLLSSEPCYIRYNNLKPAMLHSGTFEMGKAEMINDGEDITIITYGMLLRQAYEAMIMLETKGISVRLLNMRTLKPVDEEAIINAAHQTSMIVTLEDHFLTGGLYSIVGEVFLKHNIMNSVLPIAMENKWFKPALLDDVLKFENFTGTAIAERIHQSYLEKNSEILSVRSLI